MKAYINEFTKPNGHRQSNIVMIREGGGGMSIALVRNDRGECIAASIQSNPNTRMNSDMMELFRECPLSDVLELVAAAYCLIKTDLAIEQTEIN